MAASWFVVERGKGGCFVSSSFARPSERRGRGSFQIGIDEWCMAAGLIYVIFGGGSTSVRGDLWEY